MNYLLSFFRRIKFKSSFYFSLPLATITALFCRDFGTFFLSLFTFSFFMQLTSSIVNYFDLKKKTGIDCKMCSYSDCVLLYPQKKRAKKKDIGSFACSSFDHGHYPNIYFCPKCKNGFLETLLSNKFEQTVKEGHELYKNVVDEVYIENISSRNLTYEKITNEYKVYFEEKDILEVGSYYGVFYNAVKDKARSYVGIEPSKHASEYVKTNFPDAQFINSNLEEALGQNQIKNKKFDTIVLWDVIEHLPNPIQTLRQLNNQLKDNGIIMFSTINIESVFSMALGPYWPWYMDMHYFYFSDRGYVDMLNRSGFVIQNHDHFRYYVYCWYFLDKAISLVFKSHRTPKYLKKALSFSVPIKLGDTVLIIGQKEGQI